MKIIGLDPGVSATGYGIIIGGKKAISGTLRPKKGDYYQKILTICKQIQLLFRRFHPDVVALEKAFYQKNVASLIKISEVRGAIICTALNARIKLIEYTPAQVKLTTTGNGRASKSQVRFIIERIFLNSKSKISQHAVDALAIAYTAQQKLR